MNPLEFMLACCQWEMMKRIELTLLGQAPDERFYTPELAALDYIPPGWESGRPTSNVPQVQSYEATSSCCGQYEKALAKAEMDTMWVTAQYQAWKASQAADEQTSNTNETAIDMKATNFNELKLNAEQVLNTNKTSNDVQQTQAPLVAYAHDTNAGNDVLTVSKKITDEEMCEACAEAQQFAEWLFSQPKPVTT